jgi:uncharacterized LabA/DUF88 family protein
MHDSVAVFIDAANVWGAQKAKGKMLDYEKLKQFLERKYAPNIVRIFFYTAYPADGTRSYSTDGKHKFLTYLKKALGFTVRKKELKRISVHTETGDIVEEKGNMDVELTIDVVHHKGTFSTAVLFTGDSDFLALINFLRRDGKVVHVFSSKNNVSYELRTGSDGYTDILQIEENIWGRDLVRRST